MSTIYIHKAQKTDRNPYILAAVYGRWPHNKLMRKGIDESHINGLSRDMTDSENEMYKKAWRYHFYRYTDIEGLISDEYECTNDLDWCKLIHETLNCSTPIEDIIEERKSRIKKS